MEPRLKDPVYQIVKLLGILIKSFTDVVKCKEVSLHTPKIKES